MFAILTEQGTLSFVEGAVSPGAIPVPDVFEPIVRSDPGRLVWNGSRVEDAASIRTWFIAADGTRRAFAMGADWQQVAGDWQGRLLRHEDGTWSIEDQATARRSALMSSAARYRWLREIGGIEVAGLRVPTDERTQAVLTGAYASAISDPAYAIPRWKVGEGAYIGLSNEQIRVIGQRVTEHIQACFDRNAEVDEAIAAGEVTTESQIEAMFAAI